MNKDHPLPQYDEMCFIISPIGKDGSPTRTRSDLVLKEIIQPAAVQNGLKILRSDYDKRPGAITSQIIRHLLNAKMVVADLTDQNPNVFYELALRHAFRKPVIQIIEKGQIVPFDTVNLRTIEYTLLNDATTSDKLSEAISHLEKARTELADYISASMSPGFEVESTVTMAARLEELTRSQTPESQSIQVMEAVLQQIGDVNKSIAAMSQLVCRPDDFKDALPPLIQNQIETILKAYSDEIAVIRSVRQAGLIDISKRRAVALKDFTRIIGEETESIMIIGSSLKGLLQREEYREIAEKLKFKLGFSPRPEIRFLLTHPIIADLRAKQEGIAPGQIVKEIIRSLEILNEWGVKASNIKLYLGTPTCFAIRTSNAMLLNPYPYMSTSYDSPCLLFEHASSSSPESLCYFYDEFSARHFGAWETELSVPITGIKEAIDIFTASMGTYSANINQLLERGKSYAKGQ